MTLVRFIGLALLLAPAPALAEIVTHGEGANAVLVPDSWPPQYRAEYDVFKSRCTKCHAMDRPIAALRTGIAPISGVPFTQDFAKKYVVRMMRKSNSGIGRDDAKDVIDLLSYLISIGKQKGPGPQ